MFNLIKAKRSNIIYRRTRTYTANKIQSFGIGLGRKSLNSTMSISPLSSGVHTFDNTRAKRRLCGRAKATFVQLQQACRNAISLKPSDAKQIFEAGCHSPLHLGKLIDGAEQTLNLCLEITNTMNKSSIDNKEYNLEQIERANSNYNDIIDKNHFEHDENGF
ncbi:hypothetical protein GJ496_009997 [Pomphorhynchus laevis]|nr:hypothetical protein GJ496_009997 [Pomphorhynchus laevis]